MGDSNPSLFANKSNRIKSRSVGGQTVSDVKAIEYDMTQVQGPDDTRMYGVMGQNFLENFTVTINYKHSCLSLQ
jgi:hypothetical protein